MTMPYTCCAHPVPRPLLNLRECGVPHHRIEHRHHFGYTHVSRCPSCGAGAIEAHVHDCRAPREPAAWDRYWWWRIDPADMPPLLRVMRSCPRPLAASCGCPVHEGLGARLPAPRAAATSAYFGPAEMPRTAVRVETGLPRWHAP
ncbi:hypothetical protein [Marinactinospora rubrisoli]|uniref:Uncharacterized protein n=1 Tax=Marinactinospora rubrisoli TaxID=2715399 RepID=A0ABW2K854_9ACTN